MHPALKIALLGWAGTGLLGSPPPGLIESRDRATLYLFITPEAPGGPEAARRARAFVQAHEEAVALRVVLLVERFRDLRTVTDESPLTRTLRALGEPGRLSIPLYDEEGLRLAEAWEVRLAPSFVLVARGRAHRSAGPETSLAALWECSP